MSLLPKQIAQGVVGPETGGAEACEKESNASSGSDGWLADDFREWKTTPYPRRTMNVYNSHQDSTKWDHIDFRTDDIVVSATVKTGCGWIEELVSNILRTLIIPDYDEESFPGVLVRSPWIDSKSPPEGVTAAVMRGQLGRRCMKTHLALDALPFSPDVRYICLVHNLNDVMSSHEFSEGLNDTSTKLVRSYSPVVSASDKQTCVQENDAGKVDSDNLGAYWHFVATWMSYKHLSNVLLVHCDHIKGNPKSEARRIAEFLGVSLSENDLDMIVHQSSIAFKKEFHHKNLGSELHSIVEENTVFLRCDRVHTTMGRVDDQTAAAILRGEQIIGGENMHFLLNGN
jgi:aryl sulfotransferase